MQRGAALVPTPGLPARLQAAFAKAQEFHRRGQLVEAERTYASVAEQAPGHFETNYLRGVVLLRLAEFAAAEQHLARAVSLDPHLASVHYNRSLALKELGRTEDALASIDRAIA